MAAQACAVVATLIGLSCSAPASLEEVARDFALMRELDVYTWRGSTGWDDYEPAAGQYAFAWLHRFADLAARREDLGLLGPRLVW